MTSMNPFTVQEHYRIRDDTTAADPGTPNWITTEDQSASETIAVDTTFRIRFLVANTGDANANSPYQLFVSKNSGSYGAVTTVSTGGAQSANASSSADATVLTTGNFQLTAGTGSAVNGEYDETGAVDANLSGGNYTELEFGVTIPAADVDNADTLDFRVYYNGAEMDQYDANTTPRIIVDEGVVTSGEGSSDGAATVSGFSGSTGSSAGVAVATGLPAEPSGTRPILESSTLTVNSTDQASLVISMPATRPDDDLYLALLGKTNTSAFTGIPGNWTEIYSAAAGSGDEAWGAAYWFEGSSEPADYTVTTSTNGNQQSVGVILRISGHKLGDPINASAVAPSGLSSSPDAPTVTTDDDDTLVIRHAISDADAMTVTPPLEIEVGETNSSGGCGYGVSQEDGPVPAGATGIAEFTMEASDDWMAGTIAIGSPAGNIGGAAGTSVVTGKSGSPASSVGVATAASQSASLASSSGIATVAGESGSLSASAGVGVALAASGSVGASEGTSIVAGESLSAETEGTGTSVGTSTAAGLSGSLASSTGVATADGESASTASSAGVGTALAVSGSVGSSAGVSVVSGVAFVEGNVGSSVGTSVVSGLSGSLASSAGVSTVTAITLTTGSSVGTSTVTGLSGSDASASGIATSAGLSGSLASSAGTSTVTGEPASVGTTEGVGSSAGSSTVSGASGALGALTGIAVVAGQSASLASSAGISTVAASSASLASSEGDSTTDAVSGSLGNSAGTSTVTSLALAVGSSAGVATVTGKSGSPALSAGIATASALSGSLAASVGTSNVIGLGIPIWHIRDETSATSWTAKTDASAETWVEKTTAASTTWTEKDMDEAA